jgi:DNA-binding IclR family transcriptional regulator
MSGFLRNSRVVDASARSAVSEGVPSDSGTWLGFVGVTQVAVAFQNDLNEIMAVIGIGGPKKRMSRVKRDEFAGSINKAADEI